MTSRSYVSIPRPYETAPGRLNVTLVFDAADAHRAGEHRATAVELARLYGVEHRTPFRATRNWTAYQEMTYGKKFGHLDPRRIEVWGPTRNIARYLAALPRVLAGLESAATRGARAFGQWRRSLLAELSGHLEFEDPTTLRIRAKAFRTQVLAHLVTFLLTGPDPARGRDNRTPLWEQSALVAAEAWEAAPVDPWAIDEHALQEVLNRVHWIEEPSVVQPTTPQPAPAAPDTVEEFLELAGPASLAPVEAAVQRPGRRIRGGVPLPAVRRPGATPWRMVRASGRQPRVGVSHAWRRRPAQRVRRAASAAPAPPARRDVRDRALAGKR